MIEFEDLTVSQQTLGKDVWYNNLTDKHYTCGYFLLQSHSYHIVNH